MEFHWDREFKETRRQVVQDSCGHFFLQGIVLNSLSPCLLFSPFLLKNLLYGKDS